MSASQIPSKTAGTKANAAVSFVGMLDTGELLDDATLDVTDATGDLTIDDVAINAATITVDGETCLAGQAVQFSVEGGTAGTTYQLLIDVDTDAGQEWRDIPHSLEVT